MGEPTHDHHRVLLVSTWFPSPGEPTSGIFVRRDAQALGEISDIHVVHLLHPQKMRQVDLDTQDDDPRITRIPLDLKSPQSILKAAQQLKLLLEDVDLLHTHAMSTLIPLKLVKVSIPWVHTEHWSGYVEWNRGWRNIIRHVMAFLARRPDIVVSVSSVLAETIKSLTGRDVSVIPNIVEYGDLTERPSYTKSRPLRLVAVGNIIERKRPILAAQICHLLNQRGRSTELTWVGDGALCKALYDYCQENAVPLRLPGVLTGEEVTAEYARADLSIFPTSAETFGLVGAEALAAGRPLVAGSNGGQRDYVEPPSGVLVDGDDPADYADAVEAVLANTRSMTAEQIASPVRRRFSAEMLAEQYKIIYDALLTTANH